MNINPTKVFSVHNETQSNNYNSHLSKTRQSTKTSTQKNNCKRKKCSEYCQKHNFEIKPIGYSNFLKKGYTQPTTINFCTKGNSTSIPIPMIPIQLRKQPQVPLFILQEDVKRYQYFSHSHEEQFQQAIRKAENNLDSEIDQDILVPIPKTKNCQICRVKIESDVEYQKHIASIEHKTVLRKSLGQKHIQDDIQNFQNFKEEQNCYLVLLEDISVVGQILKEAKKNLKLLLLKR